MEIATKENQNKFSIEEKIAKDLFIKNSRNREVMFKIFWYNMVQPFVNKNNYELCHGNDVFLKNITDEEDIILSKFYFYSEPYLKYSGKYHFREFDEKIDRLHFENKEILLKHLFDF